MTEPVTPTPDEEFRKAFLASQKDVPEGSDYPSWVNGYTFGWQAAQQSQQAEEARWRQIMRDDQFQLGQAQARIAQLEARLNRARAVARELAGAVAYSRPDAIRVWREWEQDEVEAERIAALAPSSAEELDPSEFEGGMDGFVC